MKIAYLVSRYPAVSHTFILREVQALRACGLMIETFSVRRSGVTEVLGLEAQTEAARTRALLPLHLKTLLRALLWAVSTRPRLTCQTLAEALALPGLTAGQHLKWLCYFVEALVLACWLARAQCTHLHCHFGNSGASTGMLAARLARLPFSLTCHGSELLQPRRHQLAEKVARASFVACVSHYGRAQLMLTAAPEHWSKLHVVRCGLPRMRLDGDHGVSRRGILCVGRLAPEKGHLVLLDALAALRRRGAAFDCTLVGDGPLHAEIRARIAALGMDDCVRLLGALPVEKVLELYRSAAVVVLASLSEGVPVVLMEAMAAGCPIVATRVGGVPELVQHGVTGLLVAPGDVRELAEALRQVLEDPELGRRLATAAERSVWCEFRLDASVSQLMQLFGATGAACLARPAAESVSVC